jgi:hypothetical protein
MADKASVSTLKGIAFIGNSFPHSDGDTLYLYSGPADTSIGLATCSIRELFE